MAHQDRPPAPSDPAKYDRQSRDRRQRIIDLARLLPFVGGVLIFIPLIWPRNTGAISDASPATQTSGAGIYLFLMWLVLIAAAAGLSYVYQRFGRKEP